MSCEFLVQRFCLPVRLQLAYCALCRPLLSRWHATPITAMISALVVFSSFSSLLPPLPIVVGRLSLFRLLVDFQSAGCISLRCFVLFCFVLYWHQRVASCLHKHQATYGMRAIFDVICFRQLFDLKNWLARSIIMVFNCSLTLQIWLICFIRQWIDTCPAYIDISGAEYSRLAKYHAAMAKVDGAWCLKGMWQARVHTCEVHLFIAG